MMIKTTDLLTHWGPADKMIASEFGLVTEAEWSELERDRIRACGGTVRKVNRTKGGVKEVALTRK